jgi:thymidine phosphorylase
LESGAALEKARDWFGAQGANFDAELPASKEQFVVQAPRAGWVSRVDAQTVGQIVLDLGGGRRAATDAIDPAVGIVLEVEVGTRVEAGAHLATIHAANTAAAQAAAAKLLGAIGFSDEAVAPPPLFL